MSSASTPDLGGLLAAPTVSGWDIGLAAASVVAAWVLSIFAKKGVLALLQKLQGVTPGAALLVARVVRYTVLLVGVGVAFAFLGASIQPLIAIALVVGAVIVLALRGVSNNFAAGVILQTRHPIKIGDEIEVDDYVGTVRELNGRSVVITTRDGRTVHLPNAQVLDSPLVNHSELGHRRSEIQVRAQASRESIDAIGEIVTRATRSVDGVHVREPVTVLTRTVEPNRIVMLVQLWHHPLHAPAILSLALRAIADALADAGISAVTTADIPPTPLTPPGSL